MLKQYDASKGEAEALFKLLRQRANGSEGNVAETVRAVIEAVRKEGDRALFDFCERFDHIKLDHLELREAEQNALLQKVPAALLRTMERAAANIRRYHEAQKCDGYRLERGGRTLGRIVRPLRRVGVYVPGGTAAYPSSVLMNCIPAAVAGVEEIILVTPPKADGINPAVVAAAKIAGVTKIFTVGGAQAVAALAYGTETIPAVDKIVGPGNQFVAEAKRMVFGTVDIDMIAGPSEVLVIADEGANPDYIAADLLSQLEHDVMASAILITPSQVLIESVAKAIELQLEALPRKQIAAQSLNEYSGAVLVKDLGEAVAIANKVAPEHLELMVRDPYDLLSKVENAGSIFLGAYSPEPLGDYYAGTNHVLPTGGTARFSSPLSVDDFIKKMSYLSYDRQAFLEDAEDVIRFAEAEGLGAHANAVRIRKD